MSHPLPDSERERLKVLSEYNLLDTPPEQEFDRLAGLASRLFDVPIVLISLLDRDRQFFKASVGLNVCETSRDVSFCAHAIMQDDVLLIPDAVKDPRFSSNPLVVGPPFIRFYAGQPLAPPTGEKIGTICLIDTQPRTSFSEDDHANLKDIAALVMDRMESHRLDHVRSISQARFENIAATSPDAIICSNSEGGVTFWNRSAERLFGYRAEEILNRSTEMIVPDSWLPIYEAELERLRHGEKLELADRTIELSGLRKDGTEFPAELSLSTWREGNTMSVGAIVRDITERRENEERLFRLASLDPLTDLPNRGAWRECLREALVAGRPSTVLLLDLDGFKDVNDTLGHAAGDAVLKDVASRLTTVCADAVMVARLGGDEFVALLKGNDDRAARSLADGLVRALSLPYDFAGKSVEIGVSIGIALSPQHSTRPEELLGAADLALYRAKTAGKGRYEVFAPALREFAVARRAFELELRQAFENAEFELFYQPQIAVADRTVIGAEALIRWNHRDRGLLTPASFIDVLANKPIAPAVGEWVLKTACIQASRWSATVPGFRIGVNLFAAQFRSNQLILSVKNALNESALPASQLELELVENIFLRNDPATDTLLRDLRNLGVGLAFDDYGTGYASLSLLKRYPITRLKIDRSFVHDIHTSKEDAAEVKAVLYLGDSFGMEVIAEGVETEAEFDFLRQNGCRQVQGYLFGKPMAAEEFERRLLSNAATPQTTHILP